MGIIERGIAFVASLRALANRSVWEWRRCPSCGDTRTCKHGTYTIQPWFVDGRRTIRVQRHRCSRCRRTHSEHSALLVRGSWYAREVHRFSVGHLLRAGGSLQRTAELVRSFQLPPTLNRIESDTISSRHPYPITLKSVILAGAQKSTGRVSRAHVTGLFTTALCEDWATGPERALIRSGPPAVSR